MLADGNRVMAVATAPNSSQITTWPGWCRCRYAAYAAAQTVDPAVTVIQV
jgi:hypothetical protein